MRHRWTFDAAYSAFATQGLEKDADGKVGPQQLADRDALDPGFV